MEKNDPHYAAYVQVLTEELIPAMGCTEPIAIAYAAACAREILGCAPECCDISVSGNIIKNVKSVVVPNTGGLRGIEAAAAAGAVIGRPELELQVLSALDAEGRKAVTDLLARDVIAVRAADNDFIFYIDVLLSGGGHTARVVMQDNHTNIVVKERDGEAVYRSAACGETDGNKSDRSFMCARDIIDFADTVDLADVEAAIARQIEYNSAISAEGLRGDWGAHIGQVLLKAYPDDPATRAKAAAAAGSDARMNGCSLPVVIVSGSGNQGLTASMPVVSYAEDLGVDREKLYRSVVLSDLLTIYQKRGIGSLSAFCGAVCAGAAAGAAIAYLHGGGYTEIVHTLVNALAICSGMVCDGAKSSCAAKIAMAVDAGILGYRMFLDGHEFYGGDGIVGHGTDETVRNIGRMAQDGMRATDREILNIMLET